MTTSSVKQLKQQSDTTMFKYLKEQSDTTMSSQKRSVKFHCRSRDKNFNFVALIFAALFTGSCCPGTSGFELKSDPPLDSSSDFRNVRYEDLLPRIDQFSETGVSHFSEILFDFARYQVTVLNQTDNCF